MKTPVVAHEDSVFSTRFNTCAPYFKVESKITRDFEAQCSLFTYNYAGECRCIDDVYFKG